MTNEQIKKIALANGFKLKEQKDGSLDLNAYVYDFARALIDSKWISIENGLPEKTGRYLVAREIIGKIEVTTAPFYLDDKLFFIVGDITHWQPLPEPPSEVLADDFLDEWEIEDDS